MSACRLVRQAARVVHPPSFCYVIRAELTIGHALCHYKLCHTSSKHSFIAVSLFEHHEFHHGFHKSAYLHNHTSESFHTRACPMNFLQSINESTLCFINSNSQHDAWILKIKCDVQDHVVYCKELYHVFCEGKGRTTTWNLRPAWRSFFSSSHFSFFSVVYYSIWKPLIL